MENVDRYEIIGLIITGVLFALASLPYRFGILPPATRKTVCRRLSAALLIILTGWFFRVIVLKQPA